MYEESKGLKKETAPDPRPDPPTIGGHKLHRIPIPPSENEQAPTSYTPGATPNSGIQRVPSPYFFNNRGVPVPRVGYQAGSMFPLEPPPSGPPPSRPRPRFTRADAGPRFARGPPSIARYQLLLVVSL